MRVKATDHLAHLIAVVVLSGWAASACASDALALRGVSPMIWRCAQEFDDAFHVLCVPHALGGDRRTTDAEAESRPAVAAGVSANDMRPVAQRGDAEAYSADAWRVPLHSRPTDPNFVEQLLASVLCGTHPACSVVYGGGVSRTAGR